MFKYKPHLSKHTKRTIRRKNLNNSISLRKSKNKVFQPPDPEIDFLFDSGAESNIINIPTWNEIKTLHPNLIPMKTASKLPTAQGSTITIYRKIQLFLVPTRTMEQNKLSNKPFKQTFYITDIKHNIIGIPFITKYIPTINISNSKIHIKDKYTRMGKHSFNILSKIKQTTTSFLQISPFIQPGTKTPETTIRKCI